jgi:uncharacterized protein YbjT (DUF2867 family)
MIAVAGVTGHTGRAAAEALLRDGEQVRVIVRNTTKGEPWKARGAEVAIASLDDADAVTRALTGARGAYLLVPPAYNASDLLAAQRLVADAIVAAVARSDVPHVVLLSSIGAQHATGVGPIRTLHAAEQRMRATGKPVTLFRASYFIENWAAVLDAVRGQGVLPSFIALDLAMEMIAADDVGELAAGLLRGPAPTGVQVVEAGGPAPTTPRDLARDLGNVLGRPIQPVHVSLDQVVPTFTGLGLPQNTAELFREMYEAVATGRLAYEDPAAPHIRGTRRPVDVLGPLLAS